MSQRTATFVCYIDENGKKTNKAYYCGWGVGRYQINAIMGNFLAQIGEKKFDLSGSHNMSRERLKGLKNADLSDIKQVGKLIAQMDNNNGGTVAIVNDKEQTFQIGFLLGGEEVQGTDEKPFSRFVSFNEWCAKVGKPHVDEDYRAMFLAFCDHFKITILK